MLGEGDFPGVIGDIQKTLSRFEGWGLNPNKVSVQNFEIAFAIPIGGPGSIKVGFHAQPVLVARHVESGRSNAYSIVLMAKYGAYPTAVDMISLSTKDPND